MAIVNAAFAARHFEDLVEHARRMIHEPDPALAIADVRTMRERFDLAVGAPRFPSALFAAFGVLALLLAAVGLHAVTATIVAERRNGEDISNERGGPLRLVVPHLYAWKSCKWIRGLIFMEADKAGYWEQHGYHMRGDPFGEERFRQASTT